MISPLAARASSRSCRREHQPTGLVAPGTQRPALLGGLAQAVDGRAGQLLLAHQHRRHRLERHAGHRQGEARILRGSARSGRPAAGVQVGEGTPPAPAPRRRWTGTPPTAPARARAPPSIAALPASARRPEAGRPARHAEPSAPGSAPGAGRPPGWHPVRAGAGPPPPRRAPAAAPCPSPPPPPPAPGRADRPRPGRERAGERDRATPARRGPAAWTREVTPTRWWRAASTRCRRPRG